jgi:hypothetical protein
VALRAEDGGVVAPAASWLPSRAHARIDGSAFTRWPLALLFGYWLSRRGACGLLV